jgi:glutamate racemase
VSKGCKIIVVACNTATTNAINYLRENYQIQFIGIEPAIKPAALKSKTKTVGVLATKGTLSSSLFNSTSEMHASGINIIEQEGKGLVPLIEQGKVRADETRRLLEQFMHPMLEQGIDYLVLGCTHYPYLMPVLKEILPEKVAIIDSGEAVARQTKAVLETYDLSNTTNSKAKHKFYTNADVAILNSFLNEANPSVEIDFLNF